MDASEKIVNQWQVEMSQGKKEQMNPAESNKIEGKFFSALSQSYVAVVLKDDKFLIHVND